MTAEIIALPMVWVDPSVKDDGSCNGARPIIAGFYRGDYKQADRFLEPTRQDGVDYLWNIGPAWLPLAGAGTGLQRKSTGDSVTAA
jgi:hypothetical protein